MIAGNVPLHTLRPDPGIAQSYRRRGHWRDHTVLDDLSRWREETPDAAAVVAHRAGPNDVRRITYGEYADTVERFAGALLALGVGPGQVVAIQLPNWWQAGPLMLACLRVGALVAPI